MKRGYPGYCGCTPGYVLGGIHHEDCGHVTPGVGSAGVGFTLETGNVMPGTWSGRWATLETVDF